MSRDSIFIIALPAFMSDTRSAPISRRVAAMLGARVLEVPVRSGKLDLKRSAARLAREGLTQILVEGGGVLAAALLRARLVDELHWFVAPRLLGGDGRPSLGDLGLKSLIASPLIDGRVGRLGGDLYIRGPVCYPPGRGGHAKRRRTNR